MGCNDRIRKGGGRIIVREGFAVATFPNDDVSCRASCECLETVNTLRETDGTWDNGREHAWTQAHCEDGPEDGTTHSCLQIFPGKPRAHLRLHGLCAPCATATETCPRRQTVPLQRFPRSCTRAGRRAWSRPSTGPGRSTASACCHLTGRCGSGRTTTIVTSSLVSLPTSCPCELRCVSRNTRAARAAESCWARGSYDGYDIHIKRVDAVRYFYLYHYGGVYLDLDQLCLRELEKTPLLPGVRGAAFPQHAVVSPRTSRRALVVARPCARVRCSSGTRAGRYRHGDVWLP